MLINLEYAATKLKYSYDKQSSFEISSEKQLMITYTSATVSTLLKNHTCEINIASYVVSTEALYRLTKFSCN